MNSTHRTALSPHKATMADDIDEQVTAYIRDILCFVYSIKVA